MAGESLDIYVSQMSKHHKLSTMVGENFDIYVAQMSKNDLKLSTMVGTLLNRDPVELGSCKDIY